MSNNKNEKCKNAGDPGGFIQQCLEDGREAQALREFYRQVFRVPTVLTLVILWAAYFLILLPQTWGIWVKLFMSVAAANAASPLFRAYMGAVWERAVSAQEDGPGVPVPELLAGITERARAEGTPGLIAALAFLAAVLFVAV
ncbi:MAG: hypothetical protein HPY89_00515 [Pelotomaculum sp.]|nr:hypothetical protein [Pelotomaculum sp.]